MKDLEKIKSEDLGCQVQDANPGNFAIEQEVAALVGATLPAPTEPSADDARELGAQLLVFLRRALTPIQTALRTALADIYAHLDSRCTDYTPAAYASFTPTHHAYDPMGSTPRTLPNLLTALTAFSARKISNGSAPNDGIPDGVSLVHLLCEPASVVELKDDSYGWVLNRSLNVKSTFPNCAKVTIGCKEIDMTFFGYQVGIILGGNNQGCDCEYHFPNLKKITPKVTGIGFVQGIVGVSQTHDVYCPELEEIDTGAGFGFVALVNSRNTEPYSIYIPKLRSAKAPMFDQYDLNHSTGIETLVLGPIETAFTLVSTRYGGLGLPNLIHLEFGEGTCANLDCSRWNPTNVLADADKTATFLQNFREHIALRLTSNGSGKTLTLSKAVRDAIHAAEATYGIEAIIVTQKGWTLSPAPGASSQ